MSYIYLIYYLLLSKECTVTLPLKLMLSSEYKLYIKVVVLKEIYNFVVDDFFYFKII